MPLFQELISLLAERRYAQYSEGRKRRAKEEGGAEGTGDATEKEAEEKPENEEKEEKCGKRGES